MEDHNYTKEGRAYYKLHQDKKTFDEAVQDCASQGAELISLKTEDDYSYIKKSPLSDPIATWVGK